MFVPAQVLPTIPIGFRYILGLKSSMRWSTKGTIGKEMSTSCLYDAGYSSEAGVSNPQLAMSCYAALGNICTLHCVLYICISVLQKSKTILIAICIRATHKSAHNNGCRSLFKKGLDTPKVKNILTFSSHFKENTLPELYIISTC
jgi:hypothetical protein